MSKEYNSALQARVEQFLKEKGISQAKAAPMMGISQTALSQYRRSMYDNGDIAALEGKLEEFFRTQQEQEASTEKALPYRPIQDYIPTSISEDVCKLIRYCQIEKGMVIIHGDAGIGKTKGAEKFVQENPAASVYIQATPSIGTLGNLLKVVARALKVPESRNKLDLMLSIREKLEGTNKVIIIDEAQHLQLRALEEIRAWADPNPITGQAGVGIALIGNTEVYARMVGKQEARFAQLFSRIRMNRYYSTRKVTSDDVKALFPKLAEDGRTKELTFLHGICQSKWGIRGAVNVYNNAINNEDISYEGLYEDEGAVGERSHESDRLYLTVQYSNKERTAGAFTLNEFMLFAEDPATGLETDFLYATLGDYPQGIPGHDEMLPSGVWNFPLMILISDELEVEISASPGLVTWGDMETLIAQMATEKKVSEAVARHNADTAAHPNLLGLCMGLDSRVTLMELMFRTQVKGNPFTVTFESLEGLDVAGVWNAAQGRVEF